MEAIVANVENIKFDIEIALEQQHGALPLPFPGMDSENIYLLNSFNLKSTTYCI